MSDIAPPEPLTPTLETAARPCAQPDGATARADDVSWLLARASHAFRSLVEDALAQVRLPMRSYAVLRTVAEAGAPSQQTIARATAIDKTTLVQVIDDLERDGLCTRRPDPNDRRARIIEVTPLGRERLDAAHAVIQCVESDVLPTDERAHLIAALRHLLSNPTLGTAATGSCV